MQPSMQRKIICYSTINYCTNATVVYDAIKFVSDKSLSIEPELEKHKVDDDVTVDKKRDNNNDIQGPEEEDDNQLQSTATTNTVL
jgi:hypothetical protein